MVDDGLRCGVGECGRLASVAREDVGVEVCEVAFVGGEGVGRQAALDAQIGQVGTDSLVEAGDGRHGVWCIGAVVCARFVRAEGGVIGRTSKFGMQLVDGAVRCAERIVSLEAAWTHSGSMRGKQRRWDRA